MPKNKTPQEDSVWGNSREKDLSEIMFPDDPDELRQKTRTEIAAVVPMSLLAVTAELYDSDILRSLEKMINSYKLSENGQSRDELSLVLRGIVIEHEDDEK